MNIAIPNPADPCLAVESGVVLDLPPPISVNRTRKIDWSAFKGVSAWERAADQIVLAAKRRPHAPLKLQRIARFELTLTFSEVLSRLDLDNGLKFLIDYLRRIELIEDDGPRHMRKLTIAWGEAPMGVRVSVKACD